MGAEHVTLAQILDCTVENYSNGGHYAICVADFETNHGNRIEVNHIDMRPDTIDMRINSVWDVVSGPDSAVLDYCVPGFYDDQKNLFYPYTASLGDCAGIFDDKSTLDGVTVTIDPAEYCETFIHRPGVLIIGSYYDSVINNDYRQVQTGRRCKLIFKGSPYDDKSQFDPVESENTHYMDCCLNQNCYSWNNTKTGDSIKSELSNNFQTKHCDGPMLLHCKTGDNWKTQECINWMEQRLENGSKVALELFRDRCSDNMEEPACEYFAIDAHHRAGGRYSAYFDEALDNYCTNNKDNQNCKCYLNIQYNQVVSTTEESLGPSVCWLTECSTKLKSEKWLTRDMVITRSNCEFINCMINIDTLTADKDASIKLYNYCINASLTNQDITILDTTKESTMYRKQTFGSQLNIFYFLLALFIIIAAIILFYNKPFS